MFGLRRQRSTCGPSRSRRVRRPTPRRSPRSRWTTACSTRSTRSSEALPPTEFRASLVADLRAAYQPGLGMADAFGRWLERVLGDRGLDRLRLVGCGSEAARPRRVHARAHDAGPDGQTGRARRIRPRRTRLSLPGARAGRQPGALQSTSIAAAAARFVSRTATSSWAISGFSARARPAGHRPSGRVQPERPAASDRAGHDLPDDLLCGGPERARLPRSAARRVRALRRADAADVSARQRHAARFGGGAVPDEIQAAARSAAGAGRGGAQRAAEDADSAGGRRVVLRRRAHDRSADGSRHPGGPGARPDARGRGQLDAASACSTTCRRSTAR